MLLSSFLLSPGFFCLVSGGILLSFVLFFYDLCRGMRHSVAEHLLVLEILGWSHRTKRRKMGRKDGRAVRKKGGKEGSRQAELRHCACCEYPVLTFTPSLLRLCPPSLPTALFPAPLCFSLSLLRGEYELYPTGCCVQTLGPQLVALFQKTSEVWKVGA